MQQRTRVAIVGAGPAGLALANLLHEGGVDCVVLERQSREYVQTRARAGVLEHRSVQMLERHGLAERLLANAARHETCEFRVDGRAHAMCFADLYGDPAHWVYPQQHVVSDLIASFVSRGGAIHFAVSDVTLHDIAGPAPSVSFRDGNGARHTVDCDFIAGADGYHGVSRVSVPAGALRFISRQHEFGWLAVLAQAPPSSPHVIYALHDNGFAGHMLRSRDVTRFYLQCPLTDDVSAWPDERIWAELRTRLAVDDPTWRLHEGPVLDKGMLEMRSFVTEPMCYERLFLLGDAAHVITPVGGKGMNLALHDAEVLADGLVGFYADGDEEGLLRYSDACLRRVWRCQEFSHWMIHMIHQPTGSDPDSQFHARLARARLEHLLESTTAAKAFSENYAGAPG